MKFLRRSYGQPNRARRLLWVAALFSAVSLLLGVLLGSVTIPPTQLLTGVYRQILLYVRLPRVLACFLSGAALAVAGAVIQGVLANRLASPSIIGVNAGAGLAVTLCAAAGLLGGWQIALASFVGAFAAVLAVSLGARRWGASRGTVILGGVALNSLLNALSNAIVTLKPEVGVMSNDFKMGDCSAVTYSRLLPAGVMIAVALALLLTLANELDVIGLGEDTARGLGMNTRRMRSVFLLLIALLAGAAVSIAGLLPFVGLIVPHIVRRLGGTSSRQLLPQMALFGGGFVTLCDLLARTLFTPYEIPVGIVMAFIGAPFFLFLLIRRRGGEDDA